MTNEDIARWLKSILIALVVFFILSFYLIERRGYYNLYIINKVLGSTAAILAGITLIIGPLSKKLLFFAREMSIRRHLGLIAFFLAFLHVIVSLFFLSNKFPLAWYIKEWLPITFGALAIIFWIYMTNLSRNSKIIELTAPVWEKRLSIAGQIAFVLIFLHLTVMKTEGWLKWFNGEVKQTTQLANPDFPPASLFVLFVITTVIVYRIYILLRKKTISPQDALHAVPQADELKIN